MRVLKIDANRAVLCGIVGNKTNKMMIYYMVNKTISQFKVNK